MVYTNNVFISGIVGLAVQIFGEIKFREEWLPSNNDKYKYKHGISVILACLSAILSLLLMSVCSLES